MLGCIIRIILCTVMVLCCQVQAADTEDLKTAFVLKNTTCGTTQSRIKYGLYHGVTAQSLRLSEYYLYQKSKNAEKGEEAVREMGERLAKVLNDVAALVDAGQVLTNPRFRELTIDEWRNVLGKFNQLMPASALPDAGLIPGAYEMLRDTDFIIKTLGNRFNAVDFGFRLAEALMTPIVEGTALLVSTYGDLAYEMQRLEHDVSYYAIDSYLHHCSNHQAVFTTYKLDSNHPKCLVEGGENYSPISCAAYLRAKNSNSTGFSVSYSRIDALVTDNLEKLHATYDSRFELTRHYLQQASLPETLRQFEDIPNHAWYLGAISRCRAMQLCRGFDNGTRFKPQAKISLASAIHLATQMAQMVNLPSPDISGDYPPFVEQAAGTWMYQYMIFSWDYFNPKNNENLLKGLENKPLNGPITRGEFARLLFNLLQLSPIPYQERFSDLNKAHLLRKYVEALSAAGLAGGYIDGRFGVNDLLTRAQAVKLLDLALLKGAR